MENGEKNQPDHPVTAFAVIETATRRRRPPWLSAHMNQAHILELFWGLKRKTNRSQVSLKQSLSLLRVEFLCPPQPVLKLATSRPTISGTPPTGVCPQPNLSSTAGRKIRTKICSMMCLHAPSIRSGLRLSHLVVSFVSEYPLVELLFVPVCNLNLSGRTTHTRETKRTMRKRNKINEKTGGAHFWWGLQCEAREKKFKANTCVLLRCDESRHEDRLVACARFFSKFPSHFKTLPRAESSTSRFHPPLSRSPLGQILYTFLGKDVVREHTCEHTGRDTNRKAPQSPPHLPAVERPCP